MKVLVLCGPTGVGKTEVAARLARRFDLDLVSADSRQVYSWLDIGTAKAGPDIRGEISIHMIDLVEPSRRYSAADYARDALAVMRRLTREGRRFIVVGGSGLYIKALFEPFFDAPRPDPRIRARLDKLATVELRARLALVDPARARALHPNDRQRLMRALEVHEQTGRTATELAGRTRPRPEFEPVYVVINTSREQLVRRLDERFDGMMAAGLLDEVRRLKEAGFGLSDYVANAYGYSELLRHLAGELTVEQAVAIAKQKTRDYARRQLTWFRKLPAARWIDFETLEQAACDVGTVLAGPLAGPAAG